MQLYLCKNYLYINISHLQNREFKMSVACNSFTNKCNPLSNSNLILYDAKFWREKFLVNLVNSKIRQKFLVRNFPYYSIFVLRMSL